MTDETSTPKREPPEIIFVPPAPLPPPWRMLAWVTVILLFFYTVVVRVELVLGLPVRTAAHGWTICISLLAVLGVGASACSYERSRVARLRREFEKKRPAALADPLARAVSACWARRSPPRPRDLLATLAEHRAGGGPRIMCVGLHEPPEAGEFRFEAEIITPTDAAWRPVILAPLLVGAYLLVAIVGRPTLLAFAPGFLPRLLSAVLLGAIAVAAMMPVAAVFRWLWMGILRPRYVRMAPGIIQVLEFRYRRRKPTIRSYPMTAGTLIVLSGPQEAHTMWLLRGEQGDRIVFAHMRRRGERLERAWQAMLSTAPTPPLSDEELVG